MVNAILISAMKSGSGKTTFTFGLHDYLRRKNIVASAFKTGPDYIDPMYHSIVSDRMSVNLDPYFLEPKDGVNPILEHFVTYSSGTQIAIVEGAMGYFDGIYGQGKRGSAAVVAESIDAKVILLVENQKPQQVRDYIEKYGEDKQILYLIINRCSERHYLVRRDELERVTGKKVIGYLPEDENFTLMSRHLGLYTPQKESVLRLAETVANRLEETVEMDKILQYVKEKEGEDIFKKAQKEGKFKLGFAKDDAYCFHYIDNMSVLHEHNIEPIFFSMLEDSQLPEGILGLWLSGGYPEIYADQINQKLMKEIKGKVEKGMPVIGECGGFMSLLEQMEDIRGKRQTMIGAIRGESFRTDKLVRFGYIEVEAKKDGLLLKKGQKMRSHEFHYWDATDAGRDGLATKANGSKSWECIHMNEHLHAGYPHIYLRSNEVMAKNLVRAMEVYAGKLAREEILHIQITDLDDQMAKATKRHWDKIAKPLHGLGILEDQVIQIAAILGKEDINIKKKAVVVMCADNGIVCEGVTQTDQSVTAIVTNNFAKGIASVNRIATCAQADVIPVDVGVVGEIFESKVVDKKVMKGTENFLKKDAMTQDQMYRAIMVGIEMARECKKKGYTLLGMGEMGIGNTTTSAALTSVLLDLPVEVVTGKGAGLSKDGLERKKQVIAKGIESRKPNKEDIFDVLKKLGGLDIAAMAGLVLGCASEKIPIVCDGFISLVAVFVAKKISEKSLQYVLGSHMSAEPAAKLLVENLGLCPVLDGRFCLGEGTGAAMLFGLLDMAMSVYNENRTFEDIQVEEYQDYEEEIL